MSLSINKPKYIVVTTNPPPLLPEGAQDTQVLTNVQGVNTWTYPQYNYKGSNLFPQDNFDTTSIVVTSPAYKQGGGALSPNGSIYFGSFGGWGGLRRNMKVNPYTNTFTYVNTSDQEYGFGGMVCANNGKIYALPWTGSPNKIQVIDSLNNDVVSFIDLSSLISTDYRGLVNCNNFIYAIPHNSENILRIDPSNNTVTIDASGINITNYPLMGSNTAKYSGGVVGTDGNIYCIPNTARRVLRYNPITKAITLSATPDVSGYTSGVLGLNSRIYMMPSSSANNIGIVNINTFSTAGQAVDVSLTSFRDASGGTTLISSLGSGTRFVSGILAPNGNVYCIPYGNSRFLSVDTSNNTASQIFPLTNTNVASDAYGGAVLAPNGKIYVCPLNVNYVGIIKTGLPTQQGWMYAPSFNKSP